MFSLSSSLSTSKRRKLLRPSENPVVPIWGMKGECGPISETAGNLA